MNCKNGTINLKILIIAVIVLVISLVAIYLVVKNNDKDGNNGGKEEVEIYSEKIISKTKTFTNKSTNYDIDMKYPQFENLEISFNSYINNKIEADIDYNNTYNSMALGIQDLSKAGKFTYSVTYDRYDCYDYISIVVHRTAQLGNDRRIDKSKIYVIDAKKSSTAVLQDVMGNKTDFKRKVLECINDEAFKKQIELMGGKSLTKLSDTQSFYIKDNILHIYFEASEVAPASVGALDFEMPFKLINGQFEY